MMVERPGLSKGELTVARLLWEHSPAGVRQIHAAFSAGQEMDLTTVQTYLRRIEAKGYASSVLQGRARVYTAKTKAKTVIRSTVDELVTRLFGGETMPLVRHLIEDRKISTSELADLKAIIERIEQEEHRS